MATDRNQQAKQEFQLAQARAQFARAVAAGQTGIYDDLGTLIKPGQYVVFAAPPNTWRWLVTDVAPDLRPNARPGAMRVTLTVTVPLDLPAGAKVPSLLVVGEQQVVEQPPAGGGLSAEESTDGSIGMGGAPAAAAEASATPPEAAGGEVDPEPTGVVIVDK